MSQASDQINTNNDAQQPKAARDSQLSSVAQLGDMPASDFSLNKGQINEQQTSSLNLQSMFSQGPLSDLAANYNGAAVGSMAAEFTALGNDFTAVGKDLSAIGQDASSLQTDMTNLLNQFGNAANGTYGSAGSDGQTGSSGTTGGDSGASEGGHHGHCGGGGGGGGGGNGNDTTGANPTDNPGTTATTGATPTDNPGTTATTGATPTDNPGTTATTGATPTDNPGTTATTGATPTDNPGTTATTGATPTDNPGTTATTGATPTDNPGTTATTGATPTDNPGTTTTTGATPTDNPGTTTTTGDGSGFAIQNGQLLINGQLLNGVAVTGEYVEEVGAQQAADNIASQFPGINAVRLATSPDGGAFTNGTPAPAGENESIDNINQFIQALAQKGIGTIVDNHASDANTPDNVSMDGNEAAWFGQLAQDNLGNNMVMFQTENEPMGSDQDVVAEQQAAYQAIRATGSNNIVAFDLVGGGSASPMQSDPAAYDADSNYVIDAHAYASNNPDPMSAVQSEIAQTSGLTEANGGSVPVYIGETGNSIDGSDIDPAQAQLLNGVWSDGTGAIAWLYDGAATGFGSGNGADMMTNPDGSLTGYGQEIAGLIDQGAT